jgi:hypothetical protein
MTFGLKNRGATYQKCIHFILEPQIGRNVEAYIDDVVVKLKKCGDLLDDLKETFDNLRKYKMMLNPKNMCSVYHQENCLPIWYHPRESTRTQRRWRPSNNCNQLKPKKKSRSWQAWWQHSADSYPSWVNVLCLSISYYESRSIPVEWSSSGDFHWAQAIPKVFANPGSTKARWCVAIICYTADTVVSTVITVEWPEAMTEVKH